MTDGAAPSLLHSLSIVVLTLLLLALLFLVRRGIVALFGATAEQGDARDENAD